jgi:DDE domain
MLDAGLRPRPFPDDTASLLPGLLTATRTGLSPASDDELTNQPSITSHDQPPILWMELRRRRPRLGDKWPFDEVFVKINGTTHYLWRAVDQHGNVLDILAQSRRNAVAAKRFFRVKDHPGRARRPPRV